MPIFKKQNRELVVRFLRSLIPGKVVKGYKEALRGYEN